MRRKVDRQTAEARVVKRYHRLIDPLIELTQALQDLAPTGHELGNVELRQVEGYVEIAYAARPRGIIINDGRYKFTLKIEDLGDDMARQSKGRPLIGPHSRQIDQNALVPQS